MGVSGAGKTTVGRSLAAALDGVFIDGDDLHSEAARAKMRAGEALTDADRWPWLDRIGAALAAGLSAGRPTVVACSALKRAYRDRLRAAAGPDLRFVYLAAGREAMRRRVARRRNHYMPAALVDSQFAALEPPAGEPDAIEVSAAGDLAAAIPRLAARLGGDPPQGALTRSPEMNDPLSPSHRRRRRRRHGRARSRRDCSRQAPTVAVFDRDAAKIERFAGERRARRGLGGRRRPRRALRHHEPQFGGDRRGRGVRARRRRGAPPTPGRC